MFLEQFAELLYHEAKNQAIPSMTVCYGYLDS